MKKATLILSLLLIAVMTVSAEVITVWKGTMAGDLTFFSGGDNYNALMGNGAGQGNLSAGDKIDIYYTGAIDGDKLWLQDSEWNTIDSSITGATVDLLSAGDGVYSVNVSQEFVDAIKAKGLRLRRSSGAAYSFTKINVVKGEVSGGNIVVWEGSLAATLRFTPESGSYLENYNKLIGDAAGQANLSAGDKIKFYYKGAAAGDQVWFQNKDWDNIAAIQHPAGLVAPDIGRHELMVNTDAVTAIKEKGIMLRRPNSASYSFTKVEVIKATIDEPVETGTHSIGVEGYATFYSEKAYKMPAGVTGGIVTETKAMDENGGTLMIEYNYPEGSVVPAKTALLWKGEKNDYTFEYTTSEETAPAGNLLHGTDAVNSDGMTEVAGENVKYYILSHNTNGDYGFFWAAEGGVAVAYKAPFAFLAIDFGTTGLAPKMFSLDGNGGTTGITNVETSKNNTNGKIFSVTGAYVGTDKTRLPKGIYLIDGKKSAIKYPSRQGVAGQHRLLRHARRHN